MILDIPCKIGDTVWAIRKYNGVPTPIKGKVSQMYYLDDMRLTIVVKGIARGIWMRDIFPTKEDAEERLKRK